MITTLLLSTAMSQGPIRVEIVKHGQQWQLIRAGKPYFVKGVGGTAKIEHLVASGGNSMRTWGTERAMHELDMCHEHGVTMMLGIWLGHKSYFNYKDPKQVSLQLAKCRDEVLRYRNHPALLVYGFGNEMEVDNNDIPETWQAINDIAKMAKSLDPNHPTSTVVADINDQKIANIIKYAPDIDILGINSYGGLKDLPERLKKAGWTKPYIVTEFGPNGPWELPKTEWKAAFEPTSTEKAAKYARDYQHSIVGNPNQCMGSFAFLWGDKQEETSTWFGMFLPSGERTEAVDVMTEAWTKKAASNRAPKIDSFTSDFFGKSIAVGGLLTAEVKATDPDGDSLRYQWQVWDESKDKRYAGEGEQRPSPLDGPWRSAKGASAKFSPPALPGNYRLYVFVRDGKGNAGVANFPFQVK